MSNRTTLVLAVVLLLGLQLVMQRPCSAETKEGKSIVGNGGEQKHSEVLPYTFRKTRWGMGRDDVKKSESLVPTQDTSELIIYKTILLEKKFMLGYIFQDDKLVRAKYILAEEHSNKNMYLNDYEEIVAALTKKYGTPILNETHWSKDLYKNDRSYWGTAVGLGHLSRYAKWETNDTKIYTMISGDNYEVKCALEYISKELEHLEKKAKEKQLDSQL